MSGYENLSHKEVDLIFDKERFPRTCSVCGLMAYPPDSLKCDDCGTDMFSVRLFGIFDSVNQSLDSFIEDEYELYAKEFAFDSFIEDELYAKEFVFVEEEN